MPSFEEQIEKLNFRGIVTTAIITALAFVVGLFWRDAILETINQLIPEGEGLFYKYLAAVIATVFVIVLAYILVKSQQLYIERMPKKGRKNAH